MSDVEIVLVDETSVLYHNTIIQLKLMQYTEILEIDKKSTGQLKLWYSEFETIKVSLQISKHTRIRYFVCQFCMRRVILKVNVIEYTKSWEQILIEIENTKTTIYSEYSQYLQSEYNVEYEINTITHYNIEEDKQIIMIIVKYYTMITEIKQSIDITTKRIVGYEQISSDKITVKYDLKVSESVHKIGYSIKVFLECCMF